MYQTLLRPLLFSLSSDQAHELTIKGAAWSVRHPWTQHFLPAVGVKRTFNASTYLSTTLWGLTFAHPVGLAAGFDKEGQRVEGLQESVDEILSGLAKMAKADHEIITKEALDTQWTSAWLDLVLEGLHQNSVLGKDHLHEKMVYTDLVGSVLGGLGDEDGDQYGDQDEYEEDI